MSLPARRYCFPRVCVVLAVRIGRVVGQGSGTVANQHQVGDFLLFSKYLFDGFHRT